MSVTISSYQTIVVPLGTPLARVIAASGDVSIYPEGIGAGPCITMSVRDWNMLKHSADEAIRVARNAAIAEYKACEGDGAGL